MEPEPDERCNGLVFAALAAAGGTPDGEIWHVDCPFVWMHDGQYYNYLEGFTLWFHNL